MLSNWYRTQLNDAGTAIDIVRITVALIIVMHPLHGLYYYDDIALFGGYLGSLGYPLGVQLAWLIMFVQVGCSVALLLRRFVAFACIGHGIIVCFGLWHFHRPLGWFVVGPGTGGMEWGFVLLGCLVAVAWAYWPRMTVGAVRAPQVPSTNTKLV